MHRLLSLLLVTLLSPALSAAAAEEVFSRHYAEPTLTYTALEALLWESCPQDLAAVECVVAGRDDHVGMTAPASVHREVSRQLAAVQAASAARLRLDLVMVGAGTGDSLQNLPATVVAAIEEASRSEEGRLHLDSATVSAADRAQILFATGDRSFSATLNLRRGTLDVPLRRHVSLTHDGGAEEPTALRGQILNAVVPLPLGRTTLAGTTHAHTDGPELLLLITPLP